MKVSELIELLELMDQDAEVHMAVPTSDYWRHVKVLPVQDAAELLCHSSSYTESLVLTTQEGSEASEQKYVTLVADQSLVDMQ